MQRHLGSWRHCAGVTVTVGEDRGEIFPILHELGGHFAFLHPRGLVRVFVPASHLARLRRCAGCEDGRQTSPRCVEVLPKRRAWEVMQLICFVSALIVQMRTASLLFYLIAFSFP